MAEEEKTEAADIKLESKGTMRNVEVESENVVQAVSASEEASSSPLNAEKCTKAAEQKSSCPEAEGPNPQSKGKTSKEEKTGAEKQGAEEPEEGKDETKPETEEDEDKSEGSTRLETLARVSTGWQTGFINFNACHRSEGETQGCKVHSCNILLSDFPLVSHFT